MPTTVPPIDAAPLVPSRADRATFPVRAEGWNTWEKVAFPQVVATAQSANLNAVDALAQAVASGLSAAAAASSASAAAASSGAVLWVSGATYAIGDVRRSPADLQTYARKTAGAGATDPSADPTNWTPSNALGGNAVAAINHLKGTTVASAASPDIWAALLGNFMEVSGTTTTTGFATAPRAGASRTLLALAAWPLTHGANLILPGSVNYTCAAGDLLTVTAVTATQFRVNISTASGQPAVNASGLVLLSSQLIASSVASVNFTGFLNAAYGAYRVVCVNVVPVTGSALSMRTSSDGGATYSAAGSDYTIASIGVDHTGTSVAAGSSPSAISLASIAAASSAASDGGTCATIDIFNPAGTTTKKHITFSSVSVTSTGIQSTQGAAVRNSTAAINAFQLLQNGSDIASAAIYLYGVRK